MKKRAYSFVYLIAPLLATVTVLYPAKTSAQSPVTIVATGSSMPEPLYTVWIDEYHKQRPATQIRYLAVGTAESMDRILSGNGDLGGGDEPIPEKQLKAAAHPVLELPTVLIGIAVVYNLPEASSGLRLSGTVLADIFLGKITSWSDPEIVKLNPGVKLPDLPIEVAHRNDGKGSNYIFSDFLCKVSPVFQSKVGKSVSPKWPTGTGFGRTQDLLDKVRAKHGAIGYAELNWAERSGLSTAKIRNADGEFIKPTSKSIAEAAAVLESKMADDFRISLVNAPGKESYPISSFTWLYVPAHAEDSQRGQAVKDYLQWVYSTGQGIAREKGYAELPVAVLSKVRLKVDALH